MTNHNVPMPIELAREIARQGEVRLSTLVSLGTAADARATMLCGIFGAASVGLGAAVLAYLAAEHPGAKLMASGALTALLLFVASFVAAFGAAPRDFFIAGGSPNILREWSWDGARWRSEIEMLDATAQRLAGLIEKDQKSLKLGAQRVIWSLWTAFVSVPLGVLVYFICPS